MSGIDGQVRGLNNDVLNTLRQVRNPSQITADEAQKIKGAVLKDGRVDAAESDLIKELTSTNSINIQVENRSANFSPSALSFRPAQSTAKEVLKSVEQIGTGFANPDRGEGLSTADKIGLTADITGILDPTPISDGISGIISLGQGDFVGAGLSVVSMAPYFGDAVGKPAKIMSKVLKEFPELSRLVKSVDDVPVLINTLSKLKSPLKISETLRTLNNIQKDAAIAYQNSGFLTKAKNLGLPTEGPITFVPPKRWDVNRPAKTQDGKGFLDAYGNEWRKGPSRTNGEPTEWDVVPRNKSGGIANLSRDGSHVNVSLTGVVTHR